jgi:nucleotide-binding universal stress UspA family protein
MTPVSLPASSKESISEFRFNSILLPTDFSDASDRAAYLARGIAGHFRSKLFMVHAVWQKNYEWDEALYQLGPNEDLGLKLTEEFVANHELDVLPHEIIVMSGSPVDVISKVVEEKGVDLIVLGTNGLKGPAKFLFGNYSEQIYRNAPCPVLTVGPHVGPTKCKGTFKSIVFAINPESAAAANTLRYAVTLARACDARLTVANILPESHGTHGEKLYKQEEEMRAKIVRMLDEIQPALSDKPQIIVETGHISEEIIKIAVGCGADLIVKGIRPPDAHLPNGHTYPISVNAHCPVLTVGTRTQASVLA